MDMKNPYTSLFLCLFSLSLAYFFIGSTPMQASEIQALTKSKVVEVINEVSILSGESLEPVPATENMLFKAPDFLQTGRRSRARLEAEDGTITRVGSNTLFSFDESSRTINLKKGSVLFHSPEGKGGGRVVTASATASVLGTTIIVAATSNGGFKLLVLEGTAQVAFPDGTIQVLRAGQMTFVLPKTTVAVKQSKSGEGKAEPDGSAESESVAQGEDRAEGPAPETNTEGPAPESVAGVENSARTDTKRAEPTGSKPGPVLNFDLSRMKEGADLLNGFAEPIESEAKIETATREQTILIKTGTLEPTEKLIIDLEDDDQVILGTKEIASTNQQATEDPEVTRFREALTTTVTPQSQGLIKANFFPAPGVLPPSDLGANNLEIEDKEIYITGYFAGKMHFVGGTFNLNPFRTIPDTSVPQEYFFGAKDLMTFSGNINLVGLTRDSKIGFGSLGPLQLSPGISIDVMGGGSFAGWADLHIDSSSGTADTILDGVSIQNNYGEIMLGSDRSALKVINASSLSAGLSYNSSSTFEPGLELFGRSILVDGSDVLLSAVDKIDLHALNRVTVNAANISAPHIRIEGGTVYSNGANYSSATELEMRADTLADLKNLDLSSLTSINLAARTLVLSNITFPSTGTIELGSALGHLAANPNTGASAVSGYVNFIQNVMVGDGVTTPLPAQDFVSISQGGTDSSTNSLIHLYPTN